MNRRELLKMIAVTTGTAFVGGHSLFAFSEATGADHAFSDVDIQRLDELAETILPKTDTPGAKDAGVGAFMAVFVSDCYTPAERKVFYFGLAQLEARSRAAYQRDFLELNAEQRNTLITELDREAMTHAQQQATQMQAAETQTAQNQTAQTQDNPAQTDSDEALPHYFTMMKQLTLFGFFTSEVSAQEVLRYVAVPGRYDGCVPYAGEPAWATT